MKKKMMLSIPVAFVSALPVLATESGTANQNVVSAFTTTANDMTATATALLPIALGVITLLLVVRYGIKFFKSVSNK